MAAQMFVGFEEGGRGKVAVMSPRRKSLLSDVRVTSSYRAQTQTHLHVCGSQWRPYFDDAYARADDAYGQFKGTDTRLNLQHRGFARSQLCF